MRKQTYLVKVDYCCPQIRAGGKWFEVESDEKPKLGISNRNFLSSHNCRRYLDSQDCENDASCNLQEILEVKLSSGAGNSRTTKSALAAAVLLI